MEMMLLDRAALLLWPDTPNARLAGITGRPKPTVRSWRSARRRAPAHVLSLIRIELQSRGSEISSLLRELDIELARREGEAPRRRGFMEIRERDGPGSIPRDGRNRLGRPRRATTR